MKKMIIGLTAALTMVAAVVTFATGVNDIQKGKDYLSVASTHVESSVQGSGPCNQPCCGCMGFNQRPGHYACWCGHQRFSHK